MYQVLYRKWRPKTFADVFGTGTHNHNSLNEISTNRLNHAYLFTGSRGTGKTTGVKILAKAVNCLHPVNGNPCGECEICKGIDDGSILDIVEMDAASNRKIDDIRLIIDEVQFKPAKCKYRVYIIDEVHMLTTEAFNALLKTLEEPPEHVIFILALPKFASFRQIILSRCQRFRFSQNPTPCNSRQTALCCKSEGVTLSDSAAMLAASVADGAFEMLFRFLTDVLQSARKLMKMLFAVPQDLRKTYLFELSNCVINKNTAKALEIVDRLYGESKDMARLLR